jgi:flagellar motor protein MotB
MEQNPSLSYSIQMLDHPNISSQFSNSLVQFFQSYLSDPSVQNYFNQINTNHQGGGGFIHPTISEEHEEEETETDQEQEDEENEEQESDHEQEEQEKQEQEEQDQEEQEKEQEEEETN